MATPYYLTQKKSLVLGNLEHKISDGNRESSTQVDNDDEEEEATPIKWINIIFLPFLGWWRFLMLLVVFTKCFLTPIATVYPSLHCTHEFHPWLFCYWYLVDPIYAVDTFLYIVHRQVIEEALKREYLPKSMFYIILDIISMVPLFQLLVNNLCTDRPAWWPHITGFIEIIIIYRIWVYFSLTETHSYWKIFFGYSLIFVILVNALTCLLILLTHQGICENCSSGNFDWRRYQMDRLNQQLDETYLYIYGVNYVTSLCINYVMDETKPSAVMEFGFVIILAAIGFFCKNMVICPKLFVESTLRCMKIYKFQRGVNRILQELDSKNPSKRKEVENFYSIMYVKQDGITSMSRVMWEFPWKMRVTAYYDLSWGVFHHSPSLRNTSENYKVWLSQHIILSYKMPGDSFFSGMHSNTKLYYIKSGIVQLLSFDDSVAPTLSVTGGTLFGDTSFYTPPLKREVYAKCLTYCEVFSISRQHVLQSLQLFPQDKINIMMHAKERLKHAHELYAQKHKMNAIKKCEEEGIAWLKRRWWQISDILREWKLDSADTKMCKIPPEEQDYHCSKFIGQLVLCRDVLLHTKSFFARVNFPWALNPNSYFETAWNKVVLITVYLALIFLPPYLVRLGKGERSVMFLEFMVVMDIIYVLDILVTVVTVKEGKEHEVKLFEMLFDRFGEAHFILDLLSAPWNDYIFKLFGHNQSLRLFQFNRLIKTHVLLKLRTNTILKRNYLFEVRLKIALLSFCAMYIVSYFVYLFTYIMFPKFTPGYYFAELCSSSSSAQCEINESKYHISSIVLQWITLMVTFLDSVNAPINTTADLSAVSIIMVLYTALYLYITMKHLATLCYKHNDTVNYQYMVTRWIASCWDLKRQPHLIKSLFAYFNFHWQNHHGRYTLLPNQLKREPHDVYWKVHGQPAEKLLSETPVFHGADHALIKELAQKGAFLLMPKGCILLSLGVISEHFIILVRGEITEEYPVDNEIFKNRIYKGSIIGMTSIFFGQASLKTYFAETDCEIFSLKIRDLAKVIQHYPQEWDIFETCINDFVSEFDKIYVTNLQAYDAKFISRIFYHRITIKEPKENSLKKRLQHTWNEYRTNPESTFIKTWLALRAVTVYILISSWMLEGSSYGAVIKKQMSICQWVLLCVAITDIIIKCGLPYYDERGVIISDLRLCFLHYFTRGFLVDTIGAITYRSAVIKAVIGSEAKQLLILLKHVIQFCSIYLFTGYLDYLADKPTLTAYLYKIFKWHMVAILVTLKACVFYTWECIVLKWDSDYNLIGVIVKNDQCWMPKYLTTLYSSPSLYSTILVYMQSINLVQGAYFTNFLGLHHFDFERFWRAIPYAASAVFFIYHKSMILAMLVLRSRGDYLMKRGLDQLKNYLESERIDSKLIDNIVNHFKYSWKRYGAINQDYFKRHLSPVFKDDFYYFYFKGTLKAMNSLLKTSDAILLHLAGRFCKACYMEGDEIVKEMELCDEVFVVHCGKIKITSEGKTLAVLTKGGMFGILDGMDCRPIVITATTVGKADVLFMRCDKFQSIINKQVRQSIKQHLQMSLDFIALETPFYENPYSSIEYMVRGRKMIKLPKMKNPVSAENDIWYFRWLAWSWAVSPILCTALVQMLAQVPPGTSDIIYAVVIFLDLTFLAYIISELFTVELMVVGETRLKHKYIKWKILKRPYIYIDILTLLIPFLATLTQTVYWHWIRLLRIYTVFFYFSHFSSEISAEKTIWVKIAMFALLLHSLTCGWMSINCQAKSYLQSFPVPNDLNAMQLLTSKPLFDSAEWTTPENRKNGCARTILYPRLVASDVQNNLTAFVVPTSWQSDYLISLTYVVLLQTHTNLDVVHPLTFYAIVYKNFMQYVLFWTELWFTSVAISAVSAKFRGKLEFEHEISKLWTYFKINGVCEVLIQDFKKVTKYLSSRHEITTYDYQLTETYIPFAKNLKVGPGTGCKLPSLLFQLPICLREDIFSTLFMYHMTSTTLFKDLPMYFLRQIMIRCKRVVVYPGKNIALQGDIFPCLYFIHEGEVEKWYTDRKGEARLASVISKNGYFGIIPCLYPDRPQQFTFYARTVVDSITLHNRDWRDLLNSYPAIKEKLYKHAEKELKTYKFADKKI